MFGEKKTSKKTQKDTKQKLLVLHMVSFNGKELWRLNALVVWEVQVRVEPNLLENQGISVVDIWEQVLRYTQDLEKVTLKGIQLEALFSHN